MVAATSSAAPTFMPCSSAICPARWITGPSASGSENGMPISKAAMPEVASLFPTSIDFFLVGWPAIMYAISFRSPVARTADSSRGVFSATIVTGAPAKEPHEIGGFALISRGPLSRRSLGLRGAFDGIHVLVAPARQAYEQPPARTHRPSQLARVVKRVQGLERRHDAFEASAQLEGGEGILVGHRDVLDPLQVAKERVLGPHAGIVEPSRDGMRGQHLAVEILEQVRVAAMQHAGSPRDERRRVLAALDPHPRRFDAD